jgi:hypothetical protein
MMGKFLKRTWTLGLFEALEDAPLGLTPELLEVDELVDEEEVDPWHGREDMMSWMLLKAN